VKSKIGRGFWTSWIEDNKNEENRIYTKKPQCPPGLVKATKPKYRMPFAKRGTGSIRKRMESVEKDSHKNEGAPTRGKDRKDNITLY